MIEGGPNAPEIDMEEHERKDLAVAIAETRIGLEHALTRLEVGIRPRNTSRADKHAVVKARDRLYTCQYYIEKEVAPHIEGSGPWTRAVSNIPQERLVELVSQRMDLDTVQKYWPDDNDDN